MQQPVTRQQMESFARALQAAKNDAHAPPEKIEHAKALHPYLRARDAGGTVWTVALSSLQWHRLDQDHWAAAEPPQELFLKERVLSAFQELTLRSATPASAAVTAGPPVQSATCQQCGVPLRAGQKFCTKCGATVVAPASVAPPPVASSPPIAPSSQQCPGCGRAINSSQKFCTGCGRRL